MSGYPVYEFPEAMEVMVVGDVHGEFSSLVYKLCTQYQMRNTLLIVAGDCGFGSGKLALYEQMVKKNSKHMAASNNWIVFVRGNHDNPAYFDGKVFVKKRFLAVPDYSVIHACGHRILCVGGATSVNRIPLQEEYDMKVRYDLSLKLNTDPLLPKLYWENEAPVYNEALVNQICEKEWINIVVTHTAPSGCYPFKKGIAAHYAEYDKTLLADIEQERAVMDKLLDRLLAKGMPINWWYYGHFHESKFCNWKGVSFKLLDVLEMTNVPRRFV